MSKMGYLALLGLSASLLPAGAARAADREDPALVVAEIAGDASDAAAQPRRDEETGQVLYDVAPLPADAPTATTCTLTVTPGTATNGQVLSFQVNYSPCLNSARVETFDFTWSSTLGTFTENTKREKIFFQSSGCVSGSFESTVVPTALAIKGTVTARVVVRGPSFICTATTTANVI